MLKTSVKTFAMLLRNCVPFHLITRYDIFNKVEIGILQEARVLLNLHKIPLHVTSIDFSSD